MGLSGRRSLDKSISLGSESEWVTVADLAA